MTNFIFSYVSDNLGNKYFNGRNYTYPTLPTGYYVVEYPVLPLMPRPNISSTINYNGVNVTLSSDGSVSFPGGYRQTPDNVYRFRFFTLLNNTCKVADGPKDANSTGVTRCSVMVNGSWISTYHPTAWEKNAITNYINGYYNSYVISVDYNSSKTIVCGYSTGTGRNPALLMTDSGSYGSTGMQSYSSTTIYGKIYTFDEYFATHSISYSTMLNGTVSGASTASSGNTVTLTVTPDTGYKLSSLAVYKTASQDPVSYTKVNDTTYTFVMPDANVTVTGIFVRAYTITLACSPSSAGTVTRSPSDELVTPGTNVTFTVTPNSGFLVSMMDFSTGVSVSYNQSTNVGTFEMPERLVYGTIYLALEGDPNAQGGTSQPGIGGGGDFSSTDDIVPLPPQPDGVLDPPVVPTTALGKGIIAVYNPTMSELADLGQWLYGTDWADVVFNGIRDLFLKPLDSIISLHILPVKPSTMEYKGTCFLGPHNTLIDMERVSNQYVDKYCGSLKIEPYWGSYLDYNPYTKISLFLPYIGSVDLNPDIVMDKTIGIRYRIDVVTGACVAYIYNYETVEGQGLVESVFAEYSGSMALTLPLSGSDFSQLISGFVSAVSSVMVLKSFGSSAMIAKASEDVSIANAEFVGAKEQLANAQTGWKGLKGANGQFVSYKTQRDEAIAAATDRFEEAKTGLAMARGAEKAVKSMQQATRFATVPYTVGQVMGSKVQTAISGTITGGMGLLGSQTPYLIITRPRQSLPENYKHYAGYPANFYAKLSTLTGYTKVEQCELTNIPCTDTELAMLYAALKEGVYI